VTPIGGKVDLSTPETAQPGTAVVYREDGEAAEKVFIIEESDSADPVLNKVSPRHFLAKAVDGKRIGDRFLLADNNFCP
jgi:transcription elongation GreA/GreB family factor